MCIFCTGTFARFVSRFNAKQSTQSEAGKPAESAPAKTSSKRDGTKRRANQRKKS
jgi:hypothetical protein